MLLLEVICAYMFPFNIHVFEHLNYGSVTYKNKLTALSTSLYIITIRLMKTSGAVRTSLSSEPSAEGTAGLK